MPAATDTRARYLTSLAQPNCETSRIPRARIAIRIAHTDGGAARPDRDAIIRSLERGIERRHGSREHGSRIKGDRRS